jgi:hypothetical protein
MTIDIHWDAVSRIYVGRHLEIVSQNIPPPTQAACRASSASKPRTKRRNVASAVIAGVTSAGRARRWWMDRGLMSPSALHPQRHRHLRKIHGHQPSLVEHVPCRPPPEVAGTTPSTRGPAKKKLLAAAKEGSLSTYALGTKGKSISLNVQSFSSGQHFSALRVPNLRYFPRILPSFSEFPFGTRVAPSRCVLTIRTLNL